MEEKQKNEQKPEFKGNLGFIWLIGILVILLGCTIVYTLKLTAENKDLKQTPVEVAESTNLANTEKLASTTVELNSERLEKFINKLRPMEEFNKLSEANFKDIINYINYDGEKIKINDESKITSSFSEIKELINKNFVIDDENKVNNAISNIIKEYDETKTDYFQENGGDIANAYDYVSAILNVTKSDNKYIIETVNYTAIYKSNYKNENSIKMNNVTVEDYITKKSLKTNFYNKYNNEIKELAKDATTKGWEKLRNKLAELIKEYAKENKIGYKKYIVEGTDIDNFKIESVLLAQNIGSYNKYIGKWHGEIADAGGVTITIKEKNGKLDIKWVKNLFNMDPAKEFKVKNYNIKNDKLYIELEKNDYYVENNYIIYKKNNKMYITIENDKENDFFPDELVKE